MKKLARVLLAVERGYSTSRDIARALRIRRGPVSPWLSQLAQAGLIVCVGIADGGKGSKRAGRVSYRWRVRRPGDKGTIRIGAA